MIHQTNQNLIQNNHTDRNIQLIVTTKTNIDEYKLSNY